jgi:hypothetical protein
MPSEEFVHEDFPLPSNWPSERKWQRIRELLLGAVSVEVLKASSGYTLRVWYTRSGGGQRYWPG